MPRRPRLGQHFLADARFRRRIAQALEIHSEELVVEIGSGRGAMTGLLAERARCVVAIELDPALAERLKANLYAEPRIEVLKADILGVDLGEICRRYKTEGCFVFGNLPYYITSPVIHHLLSCRRWIRAMALLVQREVALRLTAHAGTRAYGYLTILTQLYSRPAILFDVPPGAFAPPPEVHSALVGFEMRLRFPEGSRLRDGGGEEATGSALQAGEEEKFLSFVKLCFAQKRKNLLNNLARTYPRGRVNQGLTELALPSTARAEQLTLEQLARLYRGLASPERGSHDGLDE